MGHWSQTRGEASEIAAERYFEKEGYQRIARRLKTPFGEADLILRAPRHLVLVEVKSLSARSQIETRVSRGQRQRLFRIRDWLAARSQLEVRLLLACVEESGQIFLFNLGEEGLP